MRTLNLIAFQSAIDRATTRTQFARSLGKSKSWVNRAIERQTISPEIAVRIENVYGIPREHLLPDLFRRPGA